MIAIRVLDYSTRKQYRVKVPAWRYGQAIAIHKTPIGAWAVDHVPTGRRITDCGSEDEAARLAAILARQPIWHFKTMSEFRARKERLLDCLEAARRLNESEN